MKKSSIAQAEARIAFIEEKLTAEGLRTQGRTHKSDGEHLSAGEVVPEVNFSFLDKSKHIGKVEEAIRKYLTAKLADIYEKVSNGGSKEEGTKTLKDVIENQVPYLASGNYAGWYINTDQTHKLGLPLTIEVSKGAKNLYDQLNNRENLPSERSRAREVFFNLVINELRSYSEKHDKAELESDKPDSKKQLLNWDLDDIHWEMSWLITKSPKEGHFMATEKLLDGFKDKQGAWICRPLEEIAHNPSPGFTELKEKGWKEPNRETSDRVKAIGYKDTNIVTRAKSEFMKEIKELGLERSEYETKVDVPPKFLEKVFVSPEAWNGFEHKGKEVKGIEARVVAKIDRLLEKREARQFQKEETTASAPSKTTAAERSA